MNESPLPGQVLRDSPLAGYEHIEAEVADLDTANIITSEVRGKPGRHKPVLDIDLPVKLIPSSTEGHFHLMIDKEMDWEDYQRLLWVLADIGIVEEGYASASDERGYTAVRLPWISKDEDLGDPFGDCRCPGCLREERQREQAAPVIRQRACGRGWVDTGSNGVPCDCDDCHLEPDGRSRAEWMRDEQRQAAARHRPCECSDCVPSPTHRSGATPNLVIMDEVPLTPRLEAANIPAGVVRPEFVLTDHQREWLNALAVNNEEISEVSAAPPPPVVNGPHGTIQISWDPSARQLNIENPRRYGPSSA